MTSSKKTFLEADIDNFHWKVKKNSANICDTTYKMLLPKKVSWLLEVLSIRHHYTQQKGLFATLSINDTYLKHQVPICWVSIFCVILRVNVLSTSCLNVMLSVTLLIVMLSAIMLRVICAKCRGAFRFIIGLMIKLVWRLFDIDIIRQIIDYLSSGPPKNTFYICNSWMFLIS